MKLIKVTKVRTSNLKEKGEAWWINPRRIVAIGPDEGFWRLYMNDKTELTIVEDINYLSMEIEEQ